jgi:hypothetical protein
MIDRRALDVSSALRATFACALLGCSGAAAETHETTPEPVVANEPVVEQAAPVETPSPLDLLLAELSADEVRTEPLLTPTAALAACPDPVDGDCALASTAVWNAQASQWIVLDVDYSEGGPESVQLVAAAPGTETVLATHAADRAGVGVIRRALRPYARLAAPANLVTEAARVEFSSSEYAPLVALGAPLDGWLLWLSTNDDLDHAEHVLSLVNRADRRTVELSRQPAELTPCDGDGWTCEARPDEDCTAAELRAENRLCVQPRGIDFVGLSDDHASLLVMGIRLVAGDGGEPPHHWVAPITLPL